MQGHTMETTEEVIFLCDFSVGGVNSPYFLSCNASMSQSEKRA